MNADRVPVAFVSFDQSSPHVMWTAGLQARFMAAS